jgi:undecaprenyl-diphosphatase
VLALAVPLALVTSLARLYAAAHWPSDLLAGWAVGAGTAWLVHRLTRGL